MTYFDNAGRPDVLSGGVRIVPVSTPAGAHRVWTKRTGNNASTKLLLLHGGPGATHEYLLAFDSFLPASGVEYYYYDQLGSGWSDRPDDPELWTIDRFVDEVEQVRRALGLDSENFILYGQSWGGLLAIEYALAHQQELKGLIISNMMASIPAYSRACRAAPRGRLLVFKGRFRLSRRRTTALALHGKAAGSVLVAALAHRQEPTAPRHAHRRGVRRARSQTVDFELGHILGADRCVRLQSRLDEASDALDDAGGRNLGALRREGARLVEEHSADLDRIVAALAPAA